MISCEDLINDLSNYLDDEVTAEQRRALEKHLAGCKPCQIVADTTRSTVKIVTGCGSFELPPKMSSRIMAKLRETCGEGSRPAGSGAGSGSKPAGPRPAPGGSRTKRPAKRAR